MSVYDAYYQTENLFGEPYPELISYLRSYSPKGSLLDVGCGQGRDAIPLAQLGYQVVGVDLSTIGIAQMNQIAKEQDLSLRGIVHDLYAFDDFAAYAIILLDSMFHFGKKDLQKETELLRRIFDQAAQGAKIILCIQDTGKKVAILQRIIEGQAEITIQSQTALTYTFVDQESQHTSVSPYQMFILHKRDAEKT